MTFDFFICLFKFGNNSFEANLFSNNIWLESLYKVFK